MAKKNDGIWLQDKVQDALKACQEERPSFWYRFADTRSALSYLPAQPGDFMWLLPGIPAILIECKSTVEGASLQSLLDPVQLGKHRLWLRAGHLTAFVYGDKFNDVLSWYEGRDVLAKNGRPARWEGEINDAKQMLKSIRNYLLED